MKIQYITYSYDTMSIYDMKICIIMGNIEIKNKIKYKNMTNLTFREKGTKPLDGNRQNISCLI